MRCCGNSPGKSHKQFCETVRPGEHLLKSIKGLSFGQPRKERQNIIAAALLPQFKGKSKNYSRSRSQPKTKSKNRKGTANKTTAKPMRRKLEYNNENEFEQSQSSDANLINIYAQPLSVIKEIVPKKRTVVDQQ